MELSDKKKKVIDEVYKSAITGYGNIKDTYKEAYNKDPSIKYVDVQQYFKQLKDKQLTFKYKGQNSFISPHARYEFEVDLVDLTKQAEHNSGMRYGLVAIDNFSKKAWVVPIKTKQADDLINAFEEVFRHLGKPKQLYSDQEGALMSNQFKAFLQKEKINIMFSITGAHTVERFNRTLKENVFTRLRQNDIETNQWTKVLIPVLNKYNNTVHGSTGLTPNDASLDSNKLFVAFNLINKAKRNRKYPEIKEGDKVRVLLIKSSKTKGYNPSFSDKVYEVLHKDGNYYKINNENSSNKKLYMRHELLKVN